MEAFIVAILCICIVMFWAYQFIDLMLLSEADFPGRYDKILWVIVFILLFLVAPFVFVFWKQAYLAMRAAQRKSKEEATSRTGN